MKAIETLTHAGITIEIHQDEDAESPQSWGDDACFLVANHRQFYVPEPGEKRVTSDPEEILNRWKGTHWIFPLEAYIHGGVVLSFGREGNFPDRQFDVSQLGFIFASKKEWRLSAKARKAAASLIETWNQYLGGEVYGYVVDPDGEDESCWGFYGLEYCIEEAKGVAEHVAKRKAAEATEAAHWQARDLVTA